MTYTLQVLNLPGREAGWQLVQTVWESTVGLCFFPTDDPHGYTSTDEAKAVASDLSALGMATVGVFDSQVGALAFQAKANPLI